MDFLEFYGIKTDEIQDTDIRNGIFMSELLGDDFYPINKVTPVTLKESHTKMIFTFNKYKSDTLMEEVYRKNKLIKYYAVGSSPYCFKNEMFLGMQDSLATTMFCPETIDKASYAFFGGQFQHALKDDKVAERKLKDRVYDVLPMFYEMTCADDEYSEDIAKEIYKRRILLLQLEKGKEENVGTLQLFNSYYYALSLFKKYKEDKLLVLRLASRVLMGEISTLELLNLLNIYEKDLDYVVARELETIKEYVHE